MKTKHYNFSGFTLVELIVVITILVILGTIGFTSMSGFSSNARDSSRSSDLANLSKGLELAYIKTGSYPTPDSSFSVTYSGGTLWNQGTIGESVISILGAGGVKLSTKPTDPLTQTKEYTYSKLEFGNAYQLKSDWEGDIVAYQVPHLTSPYQGEELTSSKPYQRDTSLFSSPYEGGVGGGLIDQANASPGNPTITYIRGNYNGMVAKTITGSPSMTYLVAVPSLFVQTSSGSVALSATATGFYLHGQSNSGGVSFAPKLVFASGSLPSNDTEKIAFASGIANAYASYPTLASQSNIKAFIDAGMNTGALTVLGGNIVVGSLGGSASINNTQQTTPPWTVAGGGDCSAVSNTLGSDGNTSICLDNRTYNMQGRATHDRTYSLLKINKVWWFNENLAYPPATGYQGSNTWSVSTSTKYYSCPGNNSTTTADCNLVSTGGYLYQWSAAMSGATSNNDPTLRTQGICPANWGLPTKVDFTTASDGYWPDASHDGGTYYGNTTNWNPTYVGYRSNDASGTFNPRSTPEYVWSSFEDSSTTAWVEDFNTSYSTQSSRSPSNKANGFSVRCLKD